MHTWDWKKLSWPINLIAAVFNDFEPVDENALPDDVLISVEYAITLLKDRRLRELVIERFKNGKTLDEISEGGLTHSKERARQLQNKALRLLSKGETAKIIRMGLSKYMADAAQTAHAEGYRRGYAAGAYAEACKMQSQLRAMIIATSDLASMPLAERPIDLMDWSVRSYNCLKRAGYMTVGDILKAPPQDILSIRNLGIKSYAEIVSVLEKQGADMTEFKEALAAQKKEV